MILPFYLALPPVLIRTIKYEVMTKNVQATGEKETDRGERRRRKKTGKKEKEGEEQRRRKEVKEGGEGRRRTKEAKETQRYTTR